MSDKPITITPKDQAQAKEIVELLSFHPSLRNIEEEIKLQIQPSESELRLLTLRGEYLPKNEEPYREVDKITGDINPFKFTAYLSINRSSEVVFFAPPQYAKELSDVVTGKFKPMNPFCEGVTFYTVGKDGKPLSQIEWTEGFYAYRDVTFFFTEPQRTNYLAQLGKEKGEEKKDEKEFYWDGVLSFGVSPRSYASFAIHELNRMREFCIEHGMEE